MNKLTTTGFLAFALMFGFACNSDNGSVEEAQEVNEQTFEDTSMEEEKDEQSEFMTRAASSGMMEVRLGEIGQQKGQNQQVKDFGKKMVTDHGKANDQLKQLASQKSIILPDSMGQEHADKINELQDKTGNEFDQAYMEMMINAHEEDIDLFEQAANNIKDADIQSFANTTLPVLREHLEQARQINEAINNNAAANR